MHQKRARMAENDAADASVGKDPLTEVTWGLFQSFFASALMIFCDHRHAIFPK